MGSSADMNGSGVQEPLTEEQCRGRWSIYLSEVSSMMLSRTEKVFTHRSRTGPRLDAWRVNIIIPAKQRLVGGTWQPNVPSGQ